MYDDGAYAWYPAFVFSMLKCLFALILRYVLISGSYINVDLEALRHNCRYAQRLSAQGSVMAVIKADAYGHGMVPVAKALVDMVPAFAVANVREALLLREANIQRPVLLLQGINSEPELLLAAEHGFWLMLHNDEQLAYLHNARLASPVRVWLKVDTGMHRLGFEPVRVQSVYDQLQDCPNVIGDDVVLASHLASADCTDNAFTKQQIQCFNDCLSGHNLKRSLANSAALMNYEAARHDWNRAGYMLYGHSPSGIGHASLQPVMSLISRVIAVRNTAIGESVGYGNTWSAERLSRIATVAIGYADGYPRHLPSGTPVWVNGTRVALVGRVSMDMITVDVTDVSDVSVGDEVELWGRHISVNEVACCAGTIGYELLAGLSARLKRIYL